MTALPSPDSISIPGAHFDYHRSTPYEYDETADSVQISVVMSSSSRISPELVMVRPIFVPTSEIMPFTPRRLDDTDDGPIAAFS